MGKFSPPRANSFHSAFVHRKANRKSKELSPFVKMAEMHVGVPIHHNEMGTPTCISAIFTKGDSFENSVAFWVFLKLNDCSLMWI